MCRSRLRESMRRRPRRASSESFESSSLHANARSLGSFRSRRAMSNGNAGPIRGAGHRTKKGHPGGCPQMRPARGGGDGAGHTLNPPDPNQFHSHLKKNRHAPENLKEPFPGATKLKDQMAMCPGLGALECSPTQLSSAGEPVRKPRSWEYYGSKGAPVPYCRQPPLGCRYPARY